ncbi:hypothetical protein QWY90_06215 [Flavobacterium paronense]|uniref:Uncharacterized protein n=1 Tax=Flavobacterium paronense TaxID=1392775 RepID=A0ABV5GBA6_9FLAO|nr:hypothetical protein [Flavobacterium paronense]MDN3676901.1 hypothetical protein [Flavobacterium paronense]
MEDLLKQAYNLFAELVGNGMCIMPPDRNFLFYEEYDFSGLKKHRDKNTGLIGLWQSDVEIPMADLPCTKGLTMTVDFGDSAHKTGILAFCNSEKDKLNLPLYEKPDMPGFMVRHPSIPPANNWKNCTRDQLLAYSAGCWRSGKHDIVKRLLDEHNKRTNAIGMPLCQNSEENCPGSTKQFYATDVLAPHDVMFLRICSGDFDAYKDPIAQLSLQIAIEVTDRDIKVEKNQLLLQAIICGRLDLYVHVHDNFRENIMQYWVGKNDEGYSRDQAQIGEALIKVVECELRRYSGQLQTSTLGIPIETLKVLLSSDYFQIFFQGNISLLEDFTQRFIKALSSDLQKIAKEIESYINNTLKNPISILNIPFMPTNPIAKILNNLYNGTDLSEVYYRLNEIQKEIVNLTKLVNELVADVYAIPEKVAAYDATISLNTTLKQFEIYYKPYCDMLSTNDYHTTADRYKEKFEKLSDKFLDDIINFSSINNTYPFASFVISCMNVHLSCLALAGEDPSIIKSILELQYKPWFTKILNDDSDTSISKILSKLKEKQNSNKMSIPPLYTIQFKFNSLQQEREYIGDIYTDFWNIKGEIQKFDYSLVKLLDKTKIDSLEFLISRGIISEVDLPMLINEILVEKVTFSQKAKTGSTGSNRPGDVGFYFAEPDKLEIPIHLESYEAKLSLYPTNMWLLCAKRIDVWCPPFPSNNITSYNYLKEDLVNVGESIIRHATFIYNCQLAIEKIDEVVKTIDETKVV